LFDAAGPVWPSGFQLKSVALCRLGPDNVPARVGIVDAYGPTSEHGTPPSLLRCVLAAVGYREISLDRLIETALMGDEGKAVGCILPTALLSLLALKTKPLSGVVLHDRTNILDRPRRRAVAYH
jgi:hypothetical protein